MTYVFYVATGPHTPTSDRATLSHTRTVAPFHAQETGICFVPQSHALHRQIALKQFCRRPLAVAGRHRNLIKLLTPVQ